MDICKLGTGRERLRQHRRPRIFVMSIMRVVARASSHGVGAVRCGATRAPRALVQAVLGELPLDGALTDRRNAAGWASCGRMQAAIR
jgi:hypothetical protein